MIVTIKPNPHQPKSNIYVETKDVERHFFYAEIDSVGPNVKTAEIGNGVYFSSYAGVPIEFDKQDFVVIREADIIVLIK
jgi:co-chaperonin GroES (HSP10)